MNKLKAYTYYIFPDYIDLDTGEVEVRDHWINTYFWWLHQVVNYTIGFFSSFGDLENVFIIKIYKRDVKKLSSENLLKYLKLMEKWKLEF